MVNNTLHVRIISPQQIILDTQADSVSSKNVNGNFDILPKHANFITLVENSPIVVRLASRSGIPKQEPLTFTYALAIIMAGSDIVNIYTYIQSEKK